MGCTSSAPNVPEITANTTETSEDDTNNVVEDVKEDKDAKRGAVENGLKDGTASNVLPTCDSLEENIHLDRNSGSFTKIHYEEQEQDNQLTSAVEHEIIKEIHEDDSDQNKFSTIKEVADQVILNNILEEIGQITALNHEKKNNEVETVDVDTVDKSQELLETCSNEQLEDAEDPDVEESTSPSQSHGNRSTRWEALADIAAELPPSLAVDPITGQIYTLTK